MRKTLIAQALAVIMSVTPLVATSGALQSQMDSVFDSMINVTRPGVFEGQRRGVVSAGSVYVRNKIVELREKGTAVLLISADLNEILELSDSLIVMHGGEIVAYLPDSSQVTEDELGEYMLGIRRQQPEEIRRVCHEC